MPNTKSAERRTRVSARRNARNKSVKSSLRTLEKNYRTVTAAGKKEEADKALRSAVSAIDKAAKRGVIPKGRANRKKSRLALRLKAVVAKAAAPAA
jgi:small subunit ribosomal protein S20